jgi:ribosomal protein S18 acetylase RimI-like enzyme
VHPDVVVRPLSEPDARRAGGECSAAWDGQRAGRWTVLTAWLGDRLVGSGFLRWERPFLPDIAARLPGQVEVAFLQVQPDLRGHGIGTALLELAERLAGERGVRSLGLGVGDDNAGARRLYERLGYRANGLRYTVEYESVDDDGRTAKREESGTYLIKVL